jgi:hypothetical protein
MWRERHLVRVLAHIAALFPTDWIGSAGRRFRQTMRAISEYTSERHIRPSDLLESGVRKIEGLANQEYAAALKNFADIERQKIDIELQRRSLESDVRKKRAEARLAEIKAADAELELLKKLNELGVTVHQGEDGSLTIMSASWDCDLMQLRRGRSANNTDAAATE